MIVTLSICTLSHLCTANEITITVPYNNVPLNEDLKTDWGISVFIKGLQKSILFDTGGDGSILLSNMKKLKIAPAEVELIVLSHIHGDHVGGLEALLKRNNKVSVYLPSSFPYDFKNKVNSITGKSLTVKEPQRICENVWSTGELGTLIKEQSLVIATPKGLIVITGCAHPGIVDIVKFVKNHFKEDIYLVLGGFHLSSYSEVKIKEIIRELKALKVKKIAPSHCTGERAIELFEEAWGRDFIDMGCGAKIKISLEDNSE
ncbi:MBL fold metallo-hydrolase [candidate division WOR-3 bacterium]|nr:MBL fold metallo-hydrolase [candidate division WOR-3 bacterium]